MTMDRKKELLRSAALLLLSLSCGAALSLAPETAARGAAAGLDVCLGVLVPSLFPFLVLSVFLVRSGGAALLGRVFDRPFRLLFRLPGCCAPVVLMGLAGGYPVGARGAASLLREGSVSEGEARRLTAFCVNAGPAFVLSAVGAGMLRSVQAGAVLLVSGLAASLLLGLLLRGRGGARRTERRRPVRPPEKAGQALTASVSDACRSLVSMCCFVVLFSVVYAYFAPLLPPGKARAALAAVLEVTNGCRELTASGAPLWAFAAALGFGSLSVQLQILSLPGVPRVSFPRFLLARLAHAATAALLTALLTPLLPVPAESAEPVLSNEIGQPSAALAGSPAAAAALLFACTVFLLSGLSRYDAIRRKA